MAKTLSIKLISSMNMNEKRYFKNFLRKLLPNHLANRKVGNLSNHTSKFDKNFLPRSKSFELKELKWMHEFFNDTVEPIVDIKLDKLDNIPITNTFRLAHHTPKFKVTTLFHMQLPNFR